MEFILNIIFWTLALYGLYEIIKNIIYINILPNWIIWLYLESLYPFNINPFNINSLS